MHFVHDIKFHRKKRNRAGFLLAGLLAVGIFAAGCGTAAREPFVIPETQGSRENTAVCLSPEASGAKTFRGDTYLIDYSNAEEGYIMACYTGSCPKNKFQITHPDGVVYTFSLTDNLQAFPLSDDSGTYTVGIYENVKQKAYSTLMTESFSVDITNIFGAYLYPNQYVNFSEDSKAVALGSKLARSANTDLDVVSNVYNYLITNVTYDVDKAEHMPNSYLPIIDGTLETGKGICLDYAAVMATMLRTQRIPTHLEVGYAGTSYHAWISTYIKDIGWVNGIIQFDGTSWELMDPTLGASTDSDKLEKYIGDGNNYQTKYVY